MTTPSFRDQLTLWILVSVTELKMVAESVICLPFPFLPSIDSTLQVLTQMAARLETSSSSLPSGSLWPGRCLRPQDVKTQQHLNHIL